MKTNFFDHYGMNKYVCLTRAQVLTPRIIAVTFNSILLLAGTHILVTHKSTTFFYVSLFHL